MTWRSWGAGAAGLFAAIRAGETGKRVVLIEKNRRAGVKILMSGGTRCNLTNARGLRNLGVISGPIDPAYDPRQARGARSIQDAFGDNGRFLAPALRSLGVEATVALFEAEGVATKVEGNGKVFPASDRATDVLDALLRRLGRTSARLLTSCPVRSVEPEGEGFSVTFDGRSDRCQAGCGRRRRAVVSGVGDLGGRLRDRPLLRPFDRRAEAGPGADQGRCRLGARSEGPHDRRPGGLDPGGDRPSPAPASRGDALRPLRPDRPGDPRRQPRRGPSRRPRPPRPRPRLPPRHPPRGARPVAPAGRPIGPSPGRGAPPRRRSRDASPRPS